MGVSAGGRQGRVPAGVPAGGRFVSDQQPRPAVVLSSEDRVEDLLGDTSWDVRGVTTDGEVTSYVLRSPFRDEVRIDIDPTRGQFGIYDTMASAGEEVATGSFEPTTSNGHPEAVAALKSLGDPEDGNEPLDEPGNEYCAVCSRATDHVGEHDWLVEAGLAIYNPDGSVSRSAGWDDTRAALISQAEATAAQTGDVAVSPDAIGNAGQTAECAHCNQAVTSDGQGSWIDSTDGDGCDNPDGAHQSLNRAVHRLMERFAYSDLDQDALDEMVRDLENESASDAVNNDGEDFDAAHDGADAAATLINNDGRRAQIVYLVRQLGPAVAAQELASLAPGDQH